MIKINKIKNSDTLKGVLLNNHLRSNNTTSFDDNKNSLLVYDDVITNRNDTDSFTFQNKEFKSDAFKPLLIMTGVLAFGAYIASAIFKKSSSALLNSKTFEQPPDLAVNMNIKEEPQFAVYRAIRDPDFKNMLGAAAVFLMSGITIACKNFVDGAKDIWLKKQKADTEKILQDNLIEVEKDSFSGKLKIINNMLNENIRHFEQKLGEKDYNDQTFGLYKDFISFGTKDKENNDDFKNKSNAKFLSLTLSVVALCALLAKLSVSNVKKTAQNSNKYANDICEKAIDTINNLSQKQDKNDISKITELMKLICAKSEYIEEIGHKYNLSEKEIQKIIDETQESQKTIFADAPQALGGIPKKIQYYCYLDESRGHLYNWVLNPKNKFAKYIFLSFGATGAVGYLFKQVMDAIKEATVIKEGAKVDLNLKKRLVETEIENFRTKKTSAINPLVESFDKKVEEGNMSKEELKNLADNILNEIKNGPPYVYA